MGKRPGKQSQTVESGRDPREHLVHKKDCPVAAIGKMNERRETLGF